MQSGSTRRRGRDRHDPDHGSTIDVDPTVFDVINNVGSNLYRYGFGGDRGFLERDIGQYEEPAEVFAWCGGAVLLRREYLDDVGMFDEELFLYYEDTDLSWRGRLRGWRYQYVPSIGDPSPSRPVVRRSGRRRSASTPNATGCSCSPRTRPRGWPCGRSSAPIERLVVTFLRQVVLRPFVLRLPVRAEAAHQWRVVRSYVGKLPAMMRARRSARPSVDRGVPVVVDGHEVTVDRPRALVTKFGLTARRR